MGFPPILPSKGKLADSKPKLITASEEFHLALKQNPSRPIVAAPTALRNQRA